VAVDERFAAAEGQTDAVALSAVCPRRCLGLGA